MVEHDDKIKTLFCNTGTHKVIEKLSQEKVSQEEALKEFKWKVKRDHEIKVLGEVNVELESSTKKLREKLSQEEAALEEFNSTLENVLEKLSQEKDSPNDLYRFMYDTDDDASISGKSCEHFGWDSPEKDSPAGGNFLDKIPRECLSIIKSKSKVRYSRSRVTDSRANTNAPLHSFSPSNSFDLQQIAASLEDKLDIRMNRFEKSQ
nr:hypothetical protein [Tanacetum cinerariifolium]